MTTKKPPPFQPRSGWSDEGFGGAACRNRTHDLLITRAFLAVVMAFCALVTSLHPLRSSKPISGPGATGGTRIWSTYQVRIAGAERNPFRHLAPLAGGLGACPHAAQPHRASRCRGVCPCRQQPLLLPRHQPTTWIPSHWDVAGISGRARGCAS